MHVKGGDFTYQVKRMTPPGSAPIVVLHIEHATGATIIPFKPEVASTIGRQLIEAGMGIEIVGGLSKDPPSA